MFVVWKSQHVFLQDSSEVFHLQQFWFYNIPYVNKIIENTGPKIYAGKEINGYGMSVMIEQYVEAFNNGGVPNITSAW